MRKISTALLTLAGILGTMPYTKTNNAVTKDLTDYVEPYIETTHYRYFHMAPDTLPLDMAKPRPSTDGHYENKSGWKATGYDYRNTSIERFPCLHKSQIGDITLMPTVDKLFTVLGDTVMTGERRGRRSRFSHDDEMATTDYRSMLLKGYNITARMTATTRATFRRYALPANKESRILFSIGNRQGESGTIKDASV